MARVIVNSPGQHQMQDSLLHAEAESRDGASLENNIKFACGRCCGVLCYCCAASGCGCNMVTIEQGFVGVVTQFGRYDRTLQPGRHRFNIMAERVKLINLKIVCLNIPAQEMITADNLSVKIDGVCYYRVFDAQLAAFEVEDYPFALANLAKVVLRTVLGEHTLSEICAERQKLNLRLQELLDEGSHPWGMKVERVEIKGIEIDVQMQRAMAAKAEATQEAEAKVIQAKAQRDSATILTEAAAKMDKSPMAMKLQWFETMRIIATQGKNTTLVAPDGVDLKTSSSPWQAC